jgi:large repetitive protein
MRNGALPNAGHAVNDYETQAGHSVTVPPVTMAKTDLDPAVIPTIGAHKIFQIDIRLPEGTTRGLVVTDSLDAAGVSYVLANNAEFDITYTFEGIAFHQRPAAGRGGVQRFPADGTERQRCLEHRHGGHPDRERPEPKRRHSPYPHPLLRRVNNDPATDNGDTLQNSVVLTYTNGQTGDPETLADAAALVTVVEPLLTVTKTARNVTPGKQPGDPAAGGDRARVRGHRSQHAARPWPTTSMWSIRCRPSLAFFAGFTPTAVIDGTAVAGFTSTPANAPDGPLVWGRGTATTVWTSPWAGPWS